MTRRFWLRWFTWSLGCLAAVRFSRRASADQQLANLNETLRSILKCRRPEDFAFVDLVTSKVDDGSLPLSLVLSMMKWAQQRARQEVESRRRRSDFPLPYFQEGLRLRAAELGVDLPAFTP